MTSRIRTAITGAAYVIVAGLAINAGRLVTSRMRAQSVAVVPADAAVVPYTVTLTETVVTRDGRRLNAPAQTLALRSDGAAVIQLGDGRTAVRHVRLPSGVNAQVSDALRAKSTTRKPIQDSWIRAPRTNCARSLTGQVASQGEGAPTIEQMAGYRTARITGGNATSWFSLDHGCALVRRVIDYGGGETSTLELVTLIAGEPSETLFALPNDYQEGPPSAFVPPPRANCDLKCQESQRTFLERADHSYDRSRVQ
jgi:hypothetical protein